MSGFIVAYISCIKKSEKKKIYRFTNYPDNIAALKSVQTNNVSLCVCVLSSQHLSECNNNAKYEHTQDKHNIHRDKLFKKLNDIQETIQNAVFWHMANRKLQKKRCVKRLRHGQQYTGSENLLWLHCFQQYFNTIATELLANRS